MTERTGNLYAMKRKRKAEQEVITAKIVATLEERVLELTERLRVSKRHHQSAYLFGEIEGLSQAIDVITGRDPVDRVMRDNDDE